MNYRTAINISAGILLLVLQAGFVSALPGALSGVNAILVAGIFLLAGRGFKASLAWTVPLALFDELLTFGQFGYGALCFAAALGLASFLQQGYFTNRSLYSFLAIAAAADLAFRALALAGRFLPAYLEGGAPEVFASPAYWQGQAWAVSFDLLLVAAAFYALDFLNRQFQPVFLGRGKRTK